MTRAMFSLAAMLGPGLGLAQTNAAPGVDAAPGVQHVDVVGTTPLQSVKTPLADVPGNPQSASAESIAQQASLNLGELLDANLGSINASNSLGNPFQMDISYRGATASPVLGTAIGLSVFVDGVRVNEPFGDIVNWDLIPTLAIADVDLVPGSNPLFGFNTLGGAIAVSTKDGASFPGLRVTGYAGAWGRRSVEAEAGGDDVEHGIDHYVAIDLFHERGWRDFSDSDVRTLFGKLRWHQGGDELGLSLSLASNSLYSTSVLPESMLGDPRAAYTAPDFTDNRLAFVELQGARHLAPGRVLEGDLYGRLSNARNANSNAACANSVSGPEDCVARQAMGDLDASNVISDTRQLGYGGSVQWTALDALAGHPNRFVGGGSIDAANVVYKSGTYGANFVGSVLTTILPSGADAINQTGSNPYFQGGTHLDTRTAALGLFALDDFRFDEHWNLTVSGRFDLAAVNLHGATDDGSGNLSRLDGDHTFRRLNPAAGLNFNPTRDLTFYASYDEGMRVPTPVELSCANPALPCALPTGFASDPALGMIVSKTWELGARGHLSSELGWDFALYDARNLNDIQFVANGANAGVTGFFKNVGTTRRRGVEFGLHGKYDAFGFDLRYGLVDATYQSSFIEASPENSRADANGDILVTPGKRIPGIAHQTLKLRLDRDLLPRWNLGATLDVASGQYPHGDENNQDLHGPLKGYALLNLDTHVRFGQGWSAFAKVTNVFDRTNVHTFGILARNMHTASTELAVVPGAPRGVWAGLTFEFGTMGAPSAGP